MKIGALTAGAAGIVLTIASLQHAAAQTPPPRDVPARTIPVPDTVSPQMQKITPTHLQLTRLWCPGSQLCFWLLSASNVNAIVTDTTLAV